MNLKNFMLNKISHTGQTTHCMIPWIWNTRTRGRRRGSRAKGHRNLFRVHGLFFILIRVALTQLYRELWVQETERILVLFINYCIIDLYYNCKPTFAHSCIYLAKSNQLCLQNGWVFLCITISTINNKRTK